MSEVIGVKHDGGKPWAGTVLAGFWPQLRVLFSEQLNLEAVLSDGDFQRLCDVLDAFFNTSLAIPDRLVKAADLLTDVDGEVYLPHVIDVGTYGARKYARDNWLHVEGGVERYYEAVGRHVRDVMLGDWRDEESGCVNLGHIAWGILAGAELARRERTTKTMKDGVLYVGGEPVGELVSLKLGGLEYIKPALKLPIEEGKTYAVTYADGETDVGVASFERVSDDHDPLFEIAGWVVRGLDGAVPGTNHRVTGPVEP